MEVYNLEYAKNLIKLQILEKLKTKNIIYDAIVASIILSPNQYILKLTNLIAYVLSWIKFKNRIKKEFRAQVSFITENNEINTLFEPTLYYINKLTNSDLEPVKHLSTTTKNNKISEQIPSERTSTITYNNNVIEYKIRKEIITIYADREHKRQNIIIDLKSTNNIFTQFAEICIKKYEELNKFKSSQIYRNENEKWVSKSNIINRKLETVILRKNQINNIKSDLTEFINREEWYTSRDIPYARRYLFHGVPGTGKSSCIKALASYTKRNIHYLILSSVKSDTELFALMESIDFNETIIVIEDIDCACDIVNKRLTKEDDEIDKSEKSEKSETPNKLTLAGLLNAIDGGMVDTHGQIMIMTTNHLKKLDPALIRPGRIDNKFEFMNCNDYQIVELYKNFYDVYPDTSYKFKSNLSPAHVVGVFLQHQKNPIKALRSFLLPALT